MSEDIIKMRSLQRQINVITYKTTFYSRSIIYKIRIRFHTEKLEQYISHVLQVFELI